MHRLVEFWRWSLGGTIAAGLVIAAALPLIAAMLGERVAPVLGPGLAALAAAVAVLGGLWAVQRMIARRVVAPLGRITAQADALRRGAPLSDEDTDGQDEPAEIADLARVMAGLGRAMQARDAVMQGFADHMARELHEPLAVLRATAERLDRPGLKAAERRALLARIDETADHVLALVDAQRLLNRAQVRADGTSRLAAVLPALERVCPDLVFDLEQDGDLPMPADALRLVLEPLLTEAARRGAGHVWLAADETGLRLRDDIPDAPLPPPDAPVQRILAAHGATLAYRSDPPRVEITFAPES
ncbi:MAG: hypothetical protein GC146_10545 [Limimaricola sp.]|uniref:hypothetical protein n=1 Tax=Limimaricola sp. TaxID=2211665 RepID=UPI001DFBE8C7|nr:hypothetical protein [Limimaricola sp.]MBI1417649.1 hypothetical protein [Limimaricola sp.]